jgi:hypothetical protein
MRITLEEFKEIRKNLRNISDLSRLNYPRGALFTILNQKKVDHVKYDYGIAIKKLDELAGYWEKNKKFPGWLRLTPMMRIRLLLRSLNFSKKEIKKYLSDPEEIEDDSLREIVWKATFTDFIYSPIAVKHQFARGRLGENIIERWLIEKNIKFKTENDLKKECTKTPDFFFPEPLMIDGEEVNWIESKALFGDPKTHWIYWKKQFSQYLELFGNGFAIYWFGKVIGLDDRVRIWNESYFHSPMRSALLDMKIFTAGSRIYKGEKLEKIVNDLSISTIADLGADISDISFDSVRQINLDFDRVYSREFVDAVCKLIDQYSYGRILILGRERDWRKCKRRHLSWILKNMGFSVVHL